MRLLAKLPMASLARPSEAPLDERLESLEHTLTKLDKRVASALKSPTAKAVHRLRSSTRRAVALLASLAGNAVRSPRGKRAARSVPPLLRAWKKLRRAAGEVRDLDVHQRLLREAVKAQASEAASDLTRQTQELEACLERRRAKRAKQLRSHLRKHQDWLARRGKRLARALSSGLFDNQPVTSGTAADLAVDAFHQLEKQLPALDETTLHAFRKGSKAARYLAEAGRDSTDGAAQQRACDLTHQLRRIQDSIGTWHDQDLLLAEASKVLGRKNVLRRNLEASRRRALKQALVETTAASKDLRTLA